MAIRDNLLVNKNKQEMKPNKKDLSTFNLKNFMSHSKIKSVLEKRINNDTATEYVLNQCPWRSEHTNDSAFIIEYDSGAIVAGCTHASCKDENWSTLRDKADPKWRNTKNSSDSQSEILIEAGSEATLFCNESEERYAAVVVNEHEEVYRISSNKFKMWLTKKYYEQTGKAPASDAMNQALGVFEMKAMFSNKKKKIFKRCGFVNETFFYDLVNDNYKIIEISKKGWQIVDDKENIFIRNKNMKEQVTPVQFDDLSIIEKHFRYKNKEDSILHMISMVTKFIPNISHPIEVIYGEKGSSKTTSMRKDRSLVDPAVMDVLSMPTSKEDLVLSLSNNYMSCFDNLDNITSEKSNILCMASTGGALSKRTLYTNDEETILSFKVPVSLNGINVVATRADLLDRSILFELDRIPIEERKDDSTVMKHFEVDKPKMLGAIFSVLSKAMTIYDSVELNRMGRMADFSKWSYAIAEAAGIGGEVFLDAYINNQNRANEEALESHPVAAAVIKLMNNRVTWDGTVASLLRELNRISENEGINIHSKLWPKEPNILSRRLKEVKSNLDSIKIQYYIRHLSSGKYITILKEATSTEISKSIDNNDEIQDEIDDGFDKLFDDGKSIIF